MGEVPARRSHLRALGQLPQRDGDTRDRGQTCRTGLDEGDGGRPVAALRALPRDVMIATYRAHAKLYDEIQKRVPGSEQADPGATVLLISGCQRRPAVARRLQQRAVHRELARGLGQRGLGGRVPRVPRDDPARMPAEQQPNYMRVGAANPAFEQQKPFTIG